MNVINEDESIISIFLQNTKNTPQCSLIAEIAVNRAQNKAKDEPSTACLVNSSPNGEEFTAPASLSIRPGLADDVVLLVGVEAPGTGPGRGPVG